MSDAMRAMLDSKVAHPRAGVTMAWVPSPTAAVLHTLHYHQVDVSQCLKTLAGQHSGALETILTLPLLPRDLTQDQIQQELDNDARGILGYVARWVGQEMGCSKIPDIQDVGLMEDRATLRISSQHIANWLHHGITGEIQMRHTFARMAAVVDRQNADDHNYVPMAPSLDASIEFQAVLDLVFLGRDEPNGYTEKVLHTRRRQVMVTHGRLP